MPRQQSAIRTGPTSSTNWSFACPDWEDRIRDRRSLMPDMPWLDGPEAQRAIGIFNMLHLPDVPGQPSFADAGGDWFREIAAALLGSIDPETGLRRVRELFLLTPKKQSKTTNGAALMMSALLMNTRPRAEFLFIGPTKEIADLAFEQASGMIETDPEGFLQRRMHVQEHLKTITDRRTKAKLKIKAFDSNVLTGVKPAGVLIDELHEVSTNSRAARIIGQVRGGLAAIPEGFLVFITTQSDQPPAAAFRAELMTARSIRDGHAGGAMLPILYEFPGDIAKDRSEHPAWADPANWPMVMPNLGRSITLPRLIEDFETAKGKGDEEIRRWASQHLNIEIGVALASDRWAGADYWEGQADTTLTLAELLKRCEVVVVGIDGGGLDDLFGLAVLGRERKTGKWLLWTRAWAHPKVLERRKSEASRLQDFAAQGDLIVLAQLGDDIDQIADIVQQINESGLLPDENSIGVDAMGIGATVQALIERGITHEQIVSVPQGWKMMGAIKTTERRLAEGALSHAGQALMAWCVGNAKVVPKGNAIEISKQTAGTAKIDPLVASFNAVALMAMNPDSGSVYEDQELRFV